MAARRLARIKRKKRSSVRIRVKGTGAVVVKVTEAPDGKLSVVDKLRLGEAFGLYPDVERRHNRKAHIDKLKNREIELSTGVTVTVRAGIPKVWTPDSEAFAADKAKLIRDCALGMRGFVRHHGDKLKQLKEEKGPKAWKVPDLSCE